MLLFKVKLSTLPKVSCIYKITCTLTGKFYIGSAISFYKRTKDHKNALLRNNHNNQYLQNCFNKYGKDYFTIEIIKSFDRVIEYKSKDYREVLLKYEEEYILNLNPDFNIQRQPYTNFGNTGTCKPIYQYSLEGDFIRRWESRAEVIRILGFSPENGIRNQSAGGFQWSDVYVDKMPKYKHGAGVKMKIQCSLYDLLGYKIKTFDSVVELVEFVFGKYNTQYRNKIERAFSHDKPFLNKYRAARGDADFILPPTGRQRGRIVLQYDENMNFVRAWENFSTLEKTLKIQVRYNKEKGYYVNRKMIFKYLGS